MLETFISLFPEQDFEGTEIVKETYDQLSKLSDKVDWFSVIKKDNKLIVINTQLECSFHFQYQPHHRRFDYFTVPWFPYKETKENVTLAKLEISSAQMEFSKKILTGINKIMKDIHKQSDAMVADSKLLTPEEKKKYFKAVS